MVNLVLSQHVFSTLAKNEHQILTKAEYGCIIDETTDAKGVKK